MLSNMGWITMSQLGKTVPENPGNYSYGSIFLLLLQLYLPQKMQLISSQICRHSAFITQVVFKKRSLGIRHPAPNTLHFKMLVFDEVTYEFRSLEKQNSRADTDVRWSFVWLTSHSRSWKHQWFWFIIKNASKTQNSTWKKKRKATSAEGIIGGGEKKRKIGSLRMHFGWELLRAGSEIGGLFVILYNFGYISKHFYKLQPQPHGAASEKNWGRLCP